MSAYSDLTLLQQQFTAALLAPSTQIPAAIAPTDEAKRQKRFNVYRNNMHAGLVAALGARYPVILRLVGDEFFQAMALAFIRQEPPTSPILAEYGAHFARFLETFEPTADLPYLPDMARLEWLRHLAYHAPDSPIAAIAELASLAPEKLGEIRLHLHPAASHLASDYPVLTIWQTNTHDATVQPISADRPGETTLITRPKLDVLLCPLPIGAGIFITALAEGETMSQAAASALADAASFDLAKTLAALFDAGAISHIQPD
ncbi:DNA-binding domain-containing protein [Ferrovibrio sp.]|uniref:HvfC/BufC N-terminal domain-containing protein n=1 Tax=Ferrovibrio sp. TaxID=1917215 RepID=UPI0025C1C1E9|nr:DNA-binding domain-containing protein [Ferrovibrio sp.]MBX3453717.1 putative DNA-binding domain-containing protein [Ferrovibrio sp.]